jgi:hypothetical protein
MNKMAQYVSLLNIPLFEDFDRVRHGPCYTKSFLRVLNDLGGFEKENLLEKFRVRVGGRDDYELNTLVP